AGRRVVAVDACRLHRAGHSDAGSRSGDHPADSRRGSAHRLGGSGAAAASLSTRLALFAGRTLGPGPDRERMRIRIAGLLAVSLALALPAAVHAAGDADIAALQVGLVSHDLYSGNVDGYAGPLTLSGLGRLPGATHP